MSNLLKVIALLSLTVAAPGQSQADWQSHESILGAILEQVESNLRHTGEKYQIDVAPLDRRLQLPQCDRPLNVARLPGTRDLGNISVSVRCEGTQPWSLYGRAFVRLSKQVVALRTALRQGSLIAPGDVEMVEKDATSLHGGFFNPEDVIGKPVRKSLAAGTVLLPTHLTTVKLVKRGQQVAIRAQNPVFEVSMAGIALTDGEAGQRIRVRNVSSQRIIEGQVISDGTISVSP